MKLNKAVLAKARKFAKDGPRVAAILAAALDGKQAAAAGFIDADLPNVKQVALVTPDGRVWRPISLDLLP